ncbi:probable serine/threonine-protein kinase kinX [Odontomachus brunneus]|uniref:probable serine/threonine-protein kinase kinX n=1 Tax=Odontomachus brunneus TaxID=486640 RepID=UPI0013F18D50|nr:probable serine/threonine-protein kinase kinX [Odontomachus brunneus]
MFVTYSMFEDAAEFKEFAYYMKHVLSLDIRDYIEDPHEDELKRIQRRYRNRNYTQTSTYEETRENVSKIFGRWKYLKKHGEPESHFPWIPKPLVKKSLGEVFVDDLERYCGNLLIRDRCVSCVVLGHCSKENPCISVLLQNPPAKTDTLPVEEDEESRPSMKTLEIWMFFESMQRKGYRTDINIEDLNLPDEEAQDNDQKLEQPSQKVHSQYMHEQLQQLIQLQKQQLEFEQQLQKQLEIQHQRESVTSEDTRLEASNSSDTDSSSESESDEDSAEESTDQRDQNKDQHPVASVLLTPPVSNEPIVNNGLRDTSEPLENTKLYYEVKNRVNQTSSCEQIITGQTTNFCLNDHSYYQNQPPHNLECLGIQTPSESEDDEIDVVNPCTQKERSTVKQRRCPSNVSPRSNQRTQQQATIAATSDECNVETPARRPRGRPPTNPNRKRKVETESAQQPTAKRPCQRRRKPRASRKHSSDEEAEDRRSMHNNMERQRRVDLRNHFEDLRLELPEKENIKMSKVNILKEAYRYCIKLMVQSRTLKMKLAQEQKNYIRMKAKFQNLVKLAKISESQRSRILTLITSQTSQVLQEPQVA